MIVCSSQRPGGGTKREEVLASIFYSGKYLSDKELTPSRVHHVTFTYGCRGYCYVLCSSLASKSHNTFTKSWSTYPIREPIFPTSLSYTPPFRYTVEQPGSLGIYHPEILFEHVSSVICSLIQSHSSPTCSAQVIDLLQALQLFWRQWSICFLRTLIFASLNHVLTIISFSSSPTRVLVPTHGPWLDSTQVVIDDRPEHICSGASIMYGLQLSSCLLLYLAVAVIAALPYNPTTAVRLANSSTIYILRPTRDAADFELVSIDASKSLSPSDLSAAKTTSALPFSVSNATALTAASDGRGNIVFLSGDCQSGVDGTQIWKFIPDEGGNGGSWEEKKIDTTGIKYSAMNGGANFLAPVFTFSATVDSSSDLYVFGGLCPNSTDLTVETWQSSPSYSNAMLKFQQSSTSSSSDFGASTMWNREPPIAEAGFSVTPLAPTFFNVSGGSIGQQQNFILLGGQTSTAFINTSQVALYSLPEQSWSFIPVDDPADVVKTDLSMRAIDSVDPRSGHSASLSEDGRRIIIAGGWVGDVNTPADPQLAILELGDGYGGTGDWQWTIPSQQGLGFASGTGIYGHTTVMLPGGVLMITGGFSIGQSSALARRTNPVTSTTTYFFNVTSSTWITEYSNPKPPGSAASSPLSTPVSQENERKLGLGLGLGLGLAAFLGIIVICFWYRRRSQRRSAQNRRLHQLSISTEGISTPSLVSGGIDGRGGRHTANHPMSESSAGSRGVYPWAPTITGGPGSAGQVRTSEAERTGLLVEVPSPTRGLRRSLHSRGNNYWYDDGRRSRGSSHIHPIDEREEYEDEDGRRMTHDNPEMAQLSGEGPLTAGTLTSVPVFDPFIDPPLDGSRSPSPQSPAREREMEVRGWISDWAAVENIRQQQVGRVSPDRSDRTSSTLSDKSARSAVSALSYQPSVGTVTRSVSQRSGAHHSSSMAAKNDRSSVTPNDSPPHSTPPARYRRSQSLTLHRRHRSSDAATPVTSFPTLQAEGQALLGGSPSQGVRSLTQGQSRPRSWVGTIRRALTGYGDSLSPDRSSASSPTKHHRIDRDSLPQRSASAGAMVWRRRQGARDWDVEGNRGARDGDHSPSTSRADDEEWDVESAVERRVVQVMFTVPKEKLRVVNAGPEEDGASLVSVGRETDIDTSEDKGKGKAKEGS